MKSHLLAALVFLSSTAQPPHAHYSEKQITDYAKSIDVHTLDSSLSSRRLEDWLANGPPHAQVRWSLAETCDNRPERHMDFPLCAKVWFKRDGEAGSFLIQVGTSRSGVQGTPKLYDSILSWEDGPGWILAGGGARLSDLPAILDEPAYAQPVARLYDEIVSRSAKEVPSTEGIAKLKPFLSARIVQKFETVRTCIENSPGRQNGPRSGWTEANLFTGSGSRSSPASAWVVREGTQKDGSFLVLVNFFARTVDLGNGLKGGEGSPGGTWHAQVRVVRENGKFVIDDVRLFDGNSTDGPSHLLSDMLTGCSEGAPTSGT